MAKKDETLVKFACTIMWAHFAEPNTRGKFPSGKYEYTATNLSPKAVEALKSIGLKPKADMEKPEQGYYMKCKSTRPFFIQDTDGQPFEGIATIGNGTKAIVTVAPFQYNNSFGKGILASTKKIVITDVVEFTGVEVDDSHVETF